jgi:hypothetical protein
LNGKWLPGGNPLQLIINSKKTPSGEARRHPVVGSWHYRRQGDNTDPLCALVLSENVRFLLLYNPSFAR